MVRNWYRSSPIRNNMFSFNFLNFFQRFFFLWSKFRQKSGYQIIYRTEYSVPKISKDLRVELLQRLYNVQDWSNKKLIAKLIIVKSTERAESEASERFSLHQDFVHSKVNTCGQSSVNGTSCPLIWLPLFSQIF